MQEESDSDNAHEHREPPTQDGEHPEATPPRRESQLAGSWPGGTRSQQALPTDSFDEPVRKQCAVAHVRPLRVVSRITRRTRRLRCD
jgi:hypothetical protein